ncbi:DUF6894 family protein [Methylobacterium sp. J-092]|uniref:DUF6894 family protein n=1 Tax=Methylobacterium sp. J-092 TaxID=2836667 RepID=UPI001FB869FD|nr:hypothetical protein [Methylobacterium sp. J-092]MCJ2008009.1 hypothetical protein [Methylobacterium sp. J-092]
MINFDLGDHWRNPLPIDQAEHEMPRYYFNVHDDGNSLNDDGIEFADKRAAGIEALRYAGELIKAKAEQLLGGNPWYMEVTDERGLLVFRLNFRLIDFPLAAFAK